MNAGDKVKLIENAEYDYGEILLAGKIGTIVPTYSDDPYFVTISFDDDDDANYIVSRGCIEPVNDLEH